jgi:hypothetical protein
MKKFSYLALGAALVAFGGGALTTDAAFAQKRDRKAEKAEAAKAPKLSKPVQSLLAQALPLQQANNHAGAIPLIQQALAVPNATPQDKLVSYQMLMNAAQATQNNQMLVEALEGAMATGLVPAEDQVKYVSVMRTLALQAKDYQAAARHGQRLAQLQPNNAQAQFEYGLILRDAKQPREALVAMNQAIATAKASGQPAPEDYYKSVARLALDNNMQAEFSQATADWLAAYPTPQNWTTVLALFQDGAKFDDQGTLDMYRLMHAAGALNSEKDYTEYAEIANRRGFPGEAKMAIDEGLAKGKLSTAKSYTKELQSIVNPKVARDKAALAGLEAEAKKAANGRPALATGDAYYGYGNYAKAAELYRLALQKGGIDAATANLRLGAALARAGQKAEAQAALQAVQGGPRDQLADYWLIWLNGRQA